jgi:hypothetical protein
LSGPESEMDDPTPPPTPIRPVTVPYEIPWGGGRKDLRMNTYVYVVIAPVFPCPFKAQMYQYYLGPVILTSNCVFNFYTVHVSPEFARYHSKRFQYTRITPEAPMNARRIVSPALDFENPAIHAEEPVSALRLPLTEEVMRGTGPKVRVTWSCYDITEVTIEDEATMRVEFPDLHIL